MKTTTQLQHIHLTIGLQGQGLIVDTVVGMPVQPIMVVDII